MEMNRKVENYRKFKWAGWDKTRIPVSGQLMLLEEWLKW
jgi:hypothetical protein